MPHNPPSKEHVQDVTDKVRKFVEIGVDLKTACQQAGVRYQTVTKWLQYGREGDPVYTPFSDMVDGARGKFKSYLLQKLVDALEADPIKAQKTAMWLLERLSPREFGQTAYVDVMINKNTNDMDLSMLTHEELRTFMRIRKKLKSKVEAKAELIQEKKLKG